MLRILLLYKLLLLYYLNKLMYGIGSSMKLKINRRIKHIMPYMNFSSKLLLSSLFVVIFCF